MLFESSNIFWRSLPEIRDCRLHIRLDYVEGNFEDFLVRNWFKVISTLIIIKNNLLLQNSHYLVMPINFSKCLKLQLYLTKMLK